MSGTHSANPTDREHRPRRSRVAARAVVAGGAIPLLLASPADAAVSSGKIYEKTVLLQSNWWVNGCTQASLSDGGSVIVGTSANYARVADVNGQTCSGSVSANAGHLAALAWTFRNGSLCASGAATNTSPSTNVGRVTVCNDISGSQPYYQWAQAGWFKGSNCTPNDLCQNGYTYGQVRLSPTIHT